MKNTGGDEKGKLRAQGDSNSNLGGSAISLKSLHNMEAGGWNGGNNGSSTQHLIPSSEPSSPLDKEMSKSQHWSMSSYIDLHHPELKNRKPSLDAVNTGNGSSSGGGGGAAGREAASGSRSAVINSPRKSSMPASSAIQHANRPGKFSFQKYHRGSTKASQQTLEPPSLTVTAAARHHSSASNLVSAPSLNRLWKQKSANTIAIDSDFLSLGDDNVHDDDDPAAKKPRKPSSTSSDDINNNNKKRKISDSGTAMGKFLQKRGANPFKAVLPVIKTNSSRISIEEPVMPQNGIIPPPAPRRLNPILMPYVKPPSYEKYNSGRHVAEIEQQVRYRKRIKASLNTKLAPLLQQKTRLFFARRKINFVYDRKYRDVWAAALFVITFGIFLFLAYHGIVESGKILGDASKASQIGSDVIALLALAVMGGFGLSLIYFRMIQTYPGRIIKLQFTFAIGVMRGLTIYFFATASYVGGALSGLISIFLGVLVYSWRKRITFSKKLLSLVMANVSKYPAVFMMGIIGMIIVSALTTLLLISVFGWFLIVTNALGDSSSTNPISGSGNSPMPASQIYAILAFFFFTFFWSMQVMKHIIHMTVAGVLAKDYFLNALNNDMHVVMSRAGANAVAMSAFKLALTKSFGSVCLGSLFISIVGVWRAVIRSVLLGGRSKAAGSYESDASFSICLCLGNPILNLVERVYKYFNCYAFSQIAIYGKKYETACKAGYNLLHSTRLDVVVGENVVGETLFLGGVSISLVIAGASYAYYGISSFASLPNNGIYPIVIVLAAFFISLGEYLILTEVIQSGIVTFFVCIGEDPYEFRRQRPDLYKEMLDKYPKTKLELRTVKA